MEAGGAGRFSTVQAVVGLVAGLISIVGAAYSAVGTLRSAPAGEIVATVRAAGTNKPLPGAVVEVATREDALVTTMVPADDGLARRTLSPGAYRVRVRHPAFDEAVRWESPVQTFFRTATTDVRVADVVVPEGGKILMFLASANRDPRRWVDPDAFDDLDQRLGRLHDLARKHRTQPESLAAQRDALMAELEALRGAGERVRALDGEIVAAARSWSQAADALGARRQAAAQTLARATTALLGEVAERPVCKVVATRGPLHFLGEWYSHSGDDVGARQCAETSASVRANASYLHWGAVLPWSLLPLIKVPR